MTYTKEELRKELKKYFPKDSRAHLLINQVSSSGMYRHISVHQISGKGKDKRILNLSYQVAKFLDYPFKDKTRSVGVGGCGMDMGFSLIYNLSSALYKDGYKIKQSYISQGGLNVLDVFA